MALVAAQPIYDLAVLEASAALLSSMPHPLHVNLELRSMVSEQVLQN